MLNHNLHSGNNKLSAHEAKTLAFCDDNILRSQQHKERYEKVKAVCEEEIALSNEGIRFYSELSAPIRRKLEQAEQEVGGANASKTLTDTVKWGENDLQVSPGREVSLTNEEPTEGSFDSDWPYRQKIKYVLERPEKYGSRTFKGSNSITDAILAEQPQWLKQHKRSVILGKIAPEVSRMVGKEIFKFYTIGKPSEVHYINADWFIHKDTSKVKPEFADRIADLEPATPEKKLAPVAAGASAESETDVGEKHSGDAAENPNGRSYDLLGDSHSH